MKFIPVVHQSGNITQQPGRFICCYDGRQFVVTDDATIRLGEFQIAVQAPQIPGSKVYFVTSDNTLQYTGQRTVVLNPIADWDQSDSTSLDYIKNKPGLLQAVYLVKPYNAGRTRIIATQQVQDTTLVLDNIDTYTQGITFIIGD